MKNSMRLECLSLSENELFVRNTVALFALPLEPSVSELSDIKTAVSEAVTNAIVHAYSGKDGRIVVECFIEDKTLHIKIVDEGRGIADLNKAVQPFFTTLEGEEHSGLGFTIMQTFMSDFKVESNIAGGTTVEMSKVIGAEERKDA